MKLRPDVSAPVLIAVLVACTRPATRVPRDATVEQSVLSVQRAPDDASQPTDSSRPRLVVSVVVGPSCATNDECASGLCFNAALEAQYSRVLRDCDDARTWRDGRRANTCVVDACRADGDCPDGTRCGTARMVPFPQRICLRAWCRSDVDCIAHGRIGQCVPYLAGRPCEHGGWSCVYPDDPCSPVEATRRCRPVDGVIAYCIPVDKRFQCVAENAP